MPIKSTSVATIFPFADAVVFKLLSKTVPVRFDDTSIIFGGSFTLTTVILIVMFVVLTGSLAKTMNESFP